MNSEKIEVEKSQFIRAFTFSILRTINSGGLIKKPEIEKEDVNILLPKVSELKGYSSSILHEDESSLKKLAEPLSLPLLRVNTSTIIRKKPLPEIQKPLVIPFQEGTSVPHGFGKIDLLLSDPSVTSIECPAAGQNLIILRDGQKQFTKIFLSQEEIKNILGKIASEARVPLVEGFFRAAVGNFIINSVFSETIGSRFVIKKHNPYDFLETWQNEKNNRGKT